METKADIHYDGDEDDDDDDEDDSALLITRQEEDCETSETTSDGLDHQNNQTNNGATDLNSFNENMNDLQHNTSKTNAHAEGIDADIENNLNQNTSISIHKERMEAEIETIANKRKSSDQTQMNERKSKRAKKESTNNMAVSSAHNEQMQINGVLKAENFREQQVDKENVNGAGDVFKSPLPDTVKLSKGRKGRKRTKVDKKSAEMTTPVGSSSKLKELVTPTINQNMITGDNYTTPQMDEVLQQMTLEAASKAPQKKRQSVTNSTDIEKLRALTSGRRVTRSLIAAKEAIEGKSKEQEDSAAFGGTDSHVEPRYDLGNDCDRMDPSGDARLANKPIQSNKRNSHKPEAVEVDIKADNKENQIPNEMKTEQEHSDITDNLTGTSVDKHVDDFRKHTKQDSPHFRIANAGIFYHRSNTEQGDDSFRSMSEDGSSTSQNTDTSSSPVIPLGENTNPVLEKALKNLRCTGSHSPEQVVENMDTRASPGLLLSPALSGVSEVRFSFQWYMYLKRTSLFTYEPRCEKTSFLHM